MGRKKAVRLADILTDRFSDVWKLLSQTSTFLSRTKEFGAYEDQLRSWRSQLQSRKSPELSQRVRSELTALRRHLRLQGYDLNLGKENLIFEGFRNDACIAEGFTRVVLFIGNEDIYWITGEENHVTLSEFLEKQLEGSPEHRAVIRSKHYLWYCRRKNDLVLSGSDTETKEDFERLKAIGAANPLLFLSRLKKLR
jgi:hypothetical protein